MQGRNGAIAELYHLIPKSSRGPTFAVDDYLHEIAKAMKASLLGAWSGIDIRIEAEPLEIDSDRAVPFGLLVNQLATNTIKHAFAGGSGRVVLGVEQMGAEIELTVADDGVGTPEAARVRAPEQHGPDYVAIFVRQLDGWIIAPNSQAAGTTVKARLPLTLSQKALKISQRNPARLRLERPYVCGNYRAIPSFASV